MPGLLQTPQYAHALAEADEDRTEAEIQQLVEARLLRQEVLKRRPQPLYLKAIIGEGALLRLVGGRAVMVGQLYHLAKMASMPGITVQVVPLGAGVWPGMLGPYTILRFADPELDSDAVYLETVAGEMLTDDRAQTARYQHAYDKCAEIGLSPPESRWIIVSTAERLSKER